MPVVGIGSRHCPPTRLACVPSFRNLAAFFLRGLWLWLPSLRRGGRCPVGRPGVGRVRVAGLFSLAFRRRPVENVIPSLEALPFGSAHCQLLLCLPACHLGYMRRCWPRLRALVLLRICKPRAASKGILQHDREFQPPRYLRIGQLMASAERFGNREANTI